VLILENNIQGMENTRNITQYSQEDVDNEVTTASALEEYSDGREEDGDKNLDDVRTGKRHVERV